MQETDKMNGLEAIKYIMEKDKVSVYQLGKNLNKKTEIYSMLKGKDVTTSTLAYLAEGLGYEVYILRKGSAIKPVKVSKNDK